MAQAVRYIAALSTFRMVSPMWTVLRPVTGGAFSSELVSVLDQIKDIVTWGAFSEELDDQTLRFAHQAIAEEYLRRSGVDRPSVPWALIAAAKREADRSH